MTLPKVVEILPEVEAAVIDGWHSKKTKLELCRELGMSHNRLETLWTYLRKQGKIPQMRRTGFGGRAPGEKNPYVAGVKMPTMAAMYEMEIEELGQRKSASTRLLELLREHHGCKEDKCGRFDIPPALLRIQKDARGIRRPHRV